MKFLFVLFIMFISAIEAFGQDECNIERGAVKTMSDPDTLFVRFDSVISSTVAELARLPKLDAGQSTSRLPEEREVYQVTGRLIHYKKEPDRDLHLVIKDLTSDSTIVVEVPDPTCPEVAPTSRVSAYSTITQWIKDSVGIPTTKFKDADEIVRVTGVRFSDFWHGQRGMAHNCLELHPLLSIESAETSSAVATSRYQPQLSVCPNPASQTLSIILTATGSRADVSIIDYMGVNVLSSMITLVEGRGVATLDVSSLPASLYFVHISSVEGYLGRKILIAR